MAELARLLRCKRQRLHLKNEPQHYPGHIRFNPRRIGLDGFHLLAPSSAFFRVSCLPVWVQADGEKKSGESSTPLRLTGVRIPRNSAA